MSVWDLWTKVQSIFDCSMTSHTCNPLSAQVAEALLEFVVGPAKYILQTLQNIYCIHCKMGIANIAKCILQTLQNMYSQLVYLLLFLNYLKIILCILVLISFIVKMWGAIHTFLCCALRALCMNVLRIFCIKGKEEKEASALSHICRTVRFCHRPNRESEPRCFVSFLPLHFFTTPWLQQLLHWFWTFF